LPSSSNRLHRLIGLARSMWIYHGIPGRHARLVSFYSALVPRGGLAFDIGAHVGNRVRAWRRLGARVVAAEPQPDCQTVLRWLFARDRAVTLLPQALGEVEGEASLLLSPRTPTVTTLSPEGARRVAETPLFAGVRWSETLRVPVTTLDALIERYGRPDFVKVDVEGFELAVLNGLTRPLPALSFEVLAALPDAALACIDRLERLGRHRYRACAGERFRWLQPAALDAEAMRRWIAAWPCEPPSLPGGAGSGDIYAWHVEGAHEQRGELVHAAKRTRGGHEP
jgi:FkbM family methyltransferase